MRAVVVGVLAALLTNAPAWAVDPPAVDPDTARPAATTGPGATMVQRTECVTTGIAPGTAPDGGLTGRQLHDLSEAWQISRGEGQTVAVISTGVTPGPRLPGVQAGGDYVGSSDGLTDCDGEGTIAAGIIAGQPGPDAFSGIAPAARILAIRQMSAAYAPQQPGDDPEYARAIIDVDTLARAVVRAADSGAQVIDITQVICLPIDHIVDQQQLGAALRYAAVDKDAVIIAPAGDVGSTQTSSGTGCQSNPIGPSAAAHDARNWGGVRSVAVPAWWQPFVLAVGSVAHNGLPSEFTMSGPWVGIAAPGEDIVSVSNAGDGSLTNGSADARSQWTSLDSSAYAAAYVAGVAALVRSRFPELTAVQVVQRLQQSAHEGARNPSNQVGYGVIDPLAALTWNLPEMDAAGTASGPVHIAAPTPQQIPDRLPRTIAFAGTGVLAVLVVIVAVARRRGKEQPQ